MFPINPIPINKKLRVLLLHSVFIKRKSSINFKVCFLKFANKNEITCKILFNDSNKKILQNTRFQNNDEGKRYLIGNLTKVSA